MMDGLMYWSEGEIVGRVSEFKTEAEFASAVNEETERDVELSSVERVWVRFYPVAPEELSGEFEGGCYSTALKPGRGAFECFMVEG